MRQSISPKKGIKRQLLLVGLAITIIASVTGFVGYNVVAPIVANQYPFYLGGYGTLAFYDPLSQPDQWNSESDTSIGGNCQFSSGAYHITEKQSSS